MFVSAFQTHRFAHGLGAMACGCLLALLPLAVSPLAEAQTTLTVNVNSNTGAILHGASGWLYGQAEDGLASQNLMAPTKPQYDAGKPPNGQQHAGGDVSKTIPAFLSSGGKGTQIYLQDYFSTFYPNPGISSYTSTVQSIVNGLKSNPNFQDFIYVPFNEPDGVVYGKYGTGITNLSGLESDWVTIRAINPSAKIAGPNFFLYDSTSYRSFMTYVKAHNAVPTQVTWHELTSATYTNWYTDYNDYRSIESDLGISPIPIVINEYAQATELGVPGDLVQYIARFENSKVYGCLAYWVTAGSLDYLGAAQQPNVPTGAWWLYKWYGGMLGNTVTVTPPSTTVIFGGGSGTINVALQGLTSQSYLSGKVHVTVWGIDSTGDSGTPTTGPYYIQEGDYSESSGNATVSVANTKSTSAYYLIATPAKSTSNVNSTTKYEAEYADLFGPATVTYGSNTGYSGTYFVQGYVNNNGAVTEFDVQAPNAGFYNVDLRYSSPNGNTSLNLYVNGPQLETVSLAGTNNGNTWTDNTVTLYLIKGINRIAYGANSSSTGVQLDYINVASTSGTVTTYEAAASNNTLGGTAVRENNSNAPGGTDVGYVGQGPANYVQFNGVNAPYSGTYRMLIEYSNGEVFSGPEGGAVFRSAQVSVNGGTAQQVFFDNTVNYTTYQELEVDVQLNGGSNTIKFYNSATSPNPNIESGWAPVLAQIKIASAQ
jgi:hypothetical protein